MKIQELYINNFKSLVDFKLVNPNPFSVFVGANGAGKSNIFEALEFFILSSTIPYHTLYSLFGGSNDFLNISLSYENKELIDQNFSILFKKFEHVATSLTNKFQKNTSKLQGNENLFEEIGNEYILGECKTVQEQDDLEKTLIQFYHYFSRIFIKIGKKRLNTEDNTQLSANADNLEKVLKRILQDQTKREEILDWLHLFVPELENIEVHSDNISGTETLLVYEKNTEKPLRKNLISDGTYNILALLTAIYQSDEPQFLCIEEPENGLNPYVVRQLVSLCREACEKMGHTIWLNTHSQTLVSELRPEELILVDKKNGVTRAKQFSKDKQLFGMQMDEAWLSNALGGGLPW